MVLSNILPGLRDLRAPLAAGAVFVACFILLVTPAALVAPAPNSLVSDARLLLDPIGSTGTLALAAFTAYLVGLCWEVLVNGFLINVWNRLFSISFLSRLFRDRQMSVLLSELVRVRLRREIEANDNETASNYDSAMQRMSSRGRLGDDSMLLYRMAVDRIAPMARRNLSREIPAQLVGKEDAIWATWDRLSAETDFRQMIFFPVGLLAALLGYRYGASYYLLGLLSPILLISAISKEREAIHLLLQAVKTGRATLLDGDAFPTVSWQVPEGRTFRMSADISFRTFEQGIDAAEIAARPFNARRDEIRIPRRRLFKRRIRRNATTVHSTAAPNTDSSSTN